MENILLHLLPAIFYAALALACIRTPANRRNLISGLLLAALLSHAWSLGESLLGSGALRFGFSVALSLTLWLAMLIYSLESLLRPLHGLLRRAAPVAALASLLPVLLPGHPQTLALTSWAFRTHVVVAMLAYSLFTLAVFHGLLLTAAERSIHKAHLHPDNDTPPLLALENLLFRITGAAFVFLTLTVGSGLFFSEEIFGKPLALNHKTIFGVASWLLFAILLLGRHIRGWRGKTATRWILAGFMSLLLAYAGTRFVLEVLLGRSI